MKGKETETVRPFLHLEVLSHINNLIFISTKAQKAAQKLHPD